MKKSIQTFNKLYHKLKPVSYIIKTMNQKITESQNLKSSKLDSLSITEIIRLINDEDSKISILIKELIPKISSLIKKIVTNINNGGRLIYVGAGTSGRLGVLDASECPPTFSTKPELVVGIISGGKKALYKSIENAEDNLILARKDIKKYKITENDSIIGISSSGTTPYVHEFLKESKKIGAFNSLLTSNEISEQSYINMKIECVVGPEVLTGSTRMKSGTAIKMILNIISTATMIKLNKVYRNLMVDLKINNNKLLNRAIGIITSLTDLNNKESEKLLEKAKGEVKTALLMHLSKKNYKEAKKMLLKNKENLRNCLKK